MSQRRAARFACNDYTKYSSVANMLHQLNRETLEQRRTKATIIMIVNNIVSVKFPNLFQRPAMGTRGHQLKFFNISARINSYHHSFLLSAIRLWNFLPEYTVTSPKLNTFCPQLGMHLYSV